MDTEPLDSPPQPSDAQPADFLADDRPQFALRKLFGWTAIVALVMATISPLVYAWDDDHKLILLGNLALFAAGAAVAYALHCAGRWHTRRWAGELRNRVALSKSVFGLWIFAGAGIVFIGLHVNMLVNTSSRAKFYPWSIVSGIAAGMMLSIARPQYSRTIEIRERALIYQGAAYLWTDMERVRWRDSVLQIWLPSKRFELPIAPFERERMKAILAEMRPDLALKANDLPAP